MLEIQNQEDFYLCRRASLSGGLSQSVLLSLCVRLNVRGWLRHDSTWAFFPLFLKPAHIHRIGCFDWQRHGGVNALLVMQLKSVKCQTPALFSEAYFIMASLSLSPPWSQDICVCVRVSIINPVCLLACYSCLLLSVSTGPSRILFAVRSGLQSRRLVFLSLVQTSSPLHWRWANKGLSHWSKPGSLSSQILAVAAPKLFICEWGLNREILTDLLSAFCGLLFILRLSHFCKELGLRFFQELRVRAE